MPNKNRGILSMLENYIDMFLNLIAILAGYIFVLMIFGERISIVNPVTIIIIFFNLLMCSFVYHAFNVYRQNRYVRTFRSLPEVMKVNLAYFGTMAVITAFIARSGYREYVLFWLLFTAIISTAFLAFKRHLIKMMLKALRKKQFHLRKTIIIGDNTAAAADYVKAVSENEEHGIMIMGYVGDRIDPDTMDVDKLGGFQDLERILDKYRPTDVVFAIDAYDKHRLIKLVNMCDDRCIKVFFLPVIYGFFKTSRQIEQVGMVPVINIHSTPLDNMANAAMKRAMDIIGSLLLIILTSPVMLFAAIGVFFTSPGPILFKQKRVGRLGKKFTMLKFRSMRVNNESNTAWSTGSDPRQTRFGTFLRRTAIDELPQLFNVLAGSMSLVGPRPEIPVFVEHFKETVPLYMVKHFVKPGVTGLAQIKGLRGDTSIEERIHEDINYIENWSLMLDVYILLKTPLKVINKNEKYVKESDSTAENEEMKSDVIYDSGEQIVSLNNPDDVDAVDANISTQNTESKEESELEKNSDSKENRNE